MRQWIREGRRAARLLLVAVVVALWFSGLHAEAPEPTEAYRSGLEAYRAGDADRARSAWRAAAEDGDGWAQYGLGLLHESGPGGMEADTGKAVEWYRQAADQDVPAAMNNLGLLVARGAGVDQDPREAVKLWREAAELGHGPAAYNLAASYRAGYGIRTNMREALRWYETAAERGVVDAAEALADYHAGQSDHERSQEALRWYRRAAELGSESARERLDELADQRRSTLQADNTRSEERGGNTDGGDADSGSHSSDTAAETDPGDGAGIAAVDEPPPSEPEETPAAPRSGSAGVFSLQVGSLDSAEAARREWARLQRVLPDLLGDAEALIVVEDDRYRLQTGFLTDPDTAAARCAAIRERKQQCLIIRRR
ncbi:SPOR domain-containing protein [Arhodomonas sp. SL1]|uniref:SPOR domain-containing protein n=1 Tax=Arhodomonas sp. SL1 TaxID=3425691 RepID=UPI003F885AC1